MTPRHSLLAFLTLAALAANAGPANAADSVVVPYSPSIDIQHMTTLDGTLVWTADDHLMQRDPDGTIVPVEGAPDADYRSIDLGRDGSGELVLTYLRCGGPRTGCAVYSDDLNGRRVRFKHLAPKRCAVSAAPARWGARVAYGLRCGKPHGPPNVFDAARSGVFVRKGAGPATRLRVPSASSAFASYVVTSVDLRGTDVAAVVSSEGYSGAVVQTIHSKHRRSINLSGGSEEFQDYGAGMALGSGGALWSLVDTRDGDDTSAALRRTDDEGCTVAEELPATAASAQGYGYPADAMASDGARTFLLVPDTGIVTHVFNPAPECS